MCRWCFCRVLPNNMRFRGMSLLFIGYPNEFRTGPRPANPSDREQQRQFAGGLKSFADKRLSRQLPRKLGQGARCGGNARKPSERWASPLSWPASLVQFRALRGDKTKMWAPTLARSYPSVHCGLCVSYLKGTCLQSQLIVSLCVLFGRGLVSWQGAVRKGRRSVNV